MIINSGIFVGATEVWIPKGTSDEQRVEFDSTPAYRP